MLKIPALFTRMSGAPSNRLSRPAAARSADAGEARSDSMTTASLPISSAISSSAGFVRARRATRAPAALSCRAIAAPIPREAPVTSAVRPSSAVSRLIALPPERFTVGLERPAVVRQVEEFLARLRIVPEHAAQCGRDGLGVLFLYSAHHHAQMVSFDDDADTEWIQNLAQGFGNLLGETLLHLKSLGENVDDARELRQPDNPAVRNVGNVGLAIEGQHVMLAH